MIGKAWKSKKIKAINCKISLEELKKLPVNSYGDIAISIYPSNLKTKDTDPDYIIQPDTCNVQVSNEDFFLEK